MATLLQVKQQGGVSPEAALRNDLLSIGDKASLAQRLAEINHLRAFRRLYLMGCGRSGTWLATALLATFNDIDVVAQELPVVTFGHLLTDKKILLLKRNYFSFATVEKIPDSIEILWVLRHPFDVLTSANPLTDRKYHILPDRWLGEMLALQYLFDSKRQNVRVLRYEDMVQRPVEVQKEIADHYGLSVACSFEDFEKNVSLRADPVKLDYLRSIKPRIQRLLDWVATEFSYDVAI
jgi:hypothetical protein